MDFVGPQILISQHGSHPPALKTFDCIYISSYLQMPLVLQEIEMFPLHFVCKWNYCKPSDHIIPFSIYHVGHSFTQSTSATAKKGSDSHEAKELQTTTSHFLKKKKCINHSNKLDGAIGFWWSSRVMREENNYQSQPHDYSKLFLLS